MEQTKQTKDTVGLLGKKHDDNGVPMESRNDQIIITSKTREEIEALKTTDRDQSKRINQLEQKLANLHMTPLTDSSL